jgi:PBSX family phage terminase large subunit
MSTDLIHDLPSPYSSWNIIPPWNDEACRFQRGVITPEGIWVPLLSEKGYEVFDCFKRYVLLSGCRKSAKSVVTANKFLRNMWENDGSVGALIAKTAKNAKGGAWSDMIKFVLEGWRKSGMGIKILEGPKADSVTKMEYIIINNVHGGKSEIQIHSLQHEHEVEEKFKSMRFSCIWLSEADQFKSRHVFDVLKEQLRVIGIPFNNHQFLFDCNPPEEGDEHWLHDLFYKGGDPESPFCIKNHSQFYERFQFGLDDNPFLNPQEREELENSYGHDKTLRARFIEGKWVKDTMAGLFQEQFVHNIHVIGDASSPDKSEWETIAPANVPFLITGTDIGELNHSTSFICPRIDENDDVCYDVFDEVCSIDKQVSVAEFAAKVWERTQFWNKWMMAKYKLKHAPAWHHWCDSSLFNYDASSNTNDAQIFFSESNGQIRMRPVKKGAGSIKQRIALCRRLFFSNRLLISAHCKWNVGWAQNLKPGKTKAEPVRAGSEHRHTFDATSYAIGSEIPHEMFGQQSVATSTGAISI